MRALALSFFVGLGLAAFLARDPAPAWTRGMSLTRH